MTLIQDIEPIDPEGSRAEREGKEWAWRRDVLDLSLTLLHLIVHDHHPRRSKKAETTFLKLADAAFERTKEMQRTHLPTP